MNSQILELTYKLEEAFAKKRVYLQSISEEEAAFIKRQVTISMIGSSTRIENAILTDHEIELIDTVLSDDGKISAFQDKKSIFTNKLSKDKERSIEEVAGCREMILQIYNQHADFSPLTQMHIRGLHQLLMKYYPEARHYLGQYKKITNSVVETDRIKGAVRPVFKTADPGPITEAAMAELVSWYNENMTTQYNSIAMICEFVYRFLAIHPFQDGNGRLGRGLFLLGLLQSPSESIRTIAPYISFDREIEMTRSEYYVVLNQCSDGEFKNNPNDYHIDYFISYMVKILHRSLDKIDVVLKKYTTIHQLSDSARKILNCFKDHPETRLNTKLIMQETSLPRRTVINGLNKLVEGKLIVRQGQGPSTRYQLTF